jgi:hypothetical protein
MKIFEVANDIPSHIDLKGECVTIFFSPLKCEKIRNYRCSNCGKLLFKYQSKIALVVDSSDSPKEKGPLYKPCSRCHLMHRLVW